jgi:rsbT co-antagonist protein RsbR
MRMSEQALLADLLAADADAVLQEWLVESSSGAGGTARAMASREEAGQLLNALLAGLRSGADLQRLDEPGWDPLRAALESLSAARAAQGATAGDTGRFVQALKKPAFTRLQQRLGGDAAALAQGLWSATQLVDRMAQWTVTTHQKSREDIIARQQHELLELSTPVIKLWHGVLAVPMIGTLDSNRTQIVMEALLQRIVDTGAELAIIDITGVPTVDTLVAQHLLKTVTAIRLMGADCIISGIRPQIAQTIVHLGVDLSAVSTKATLADAFVLALRRTGTDPSTLNQRG